jgi:hypothetical protein
MVSDVVRKSDSTKGTAVCRSAVLKAGEADVEEYERCRTRRSEWRRRFKDSCAQTLFAEERTIVASFE